jgi:hypothetical protein
MVSLQNGTLRLMFNMDGLLKIAQTKTNYNVFHLSVQQLHCKKRITNFVTYNNRRCSLEIYNEF